MLPGNARPPRARPLKIGSLVGLMTPPPKPRLDPSVLAELVHRASPAPMAGGHMSVLPHMNPHPAIGQLPPQVTSSHPLVAGLISGLLGHGARIDPFISPGEPMAPSMPHGFAPDQGPASGSMEDPALNDPRARLLAMLLASAMRNAPSGPVPPGYGSL